MQIMKDMYKERGQYQVFFRIIFNKINNYPIFKLIVYITNSKINSSYNVTINVKIPAIALF